MNTRVRQGAELLDRHCPDWHWRVNLAKLDMGSRRRCVLGQLYGDYLLGANQLLSDRSVDQDCYDHGFNTWWGTSWLYRIMRPLDIGVAALTAAWSNEILERRDRDEFIHLMTPTANPELLEV